MIARSGALLLAMALASSACSLLPVMSQGQATSCDELYSQDQCLAMVDVAAAEVGKNRGDVEAIAIVPDPPPEDATLGGAWPIRVRIVLKDGSTHEARVCGGLPRGPACSEDPRLEVRSAVDGGYTDVPCGSDPDKPEECATPLPALEASAIDAATPITVASLSIPIDKPGAHTIVLGAGSLPNGVWKTASLQLADPWPHELALRDGIVTIGVRSLEPDGKPFDNYYVHGWRPGIERIEAVLVFDVLWFEPGATLDIRNVVVR